MIQGSGKSTNGTKYTGNLKRERYLLLNGMPMKKQKKETMAKE